MEKLITVCGATGGVGGSVARHMLKQGWSVRALTRNTDSPAARALAELGAQLTTADYDDVASLKRAFEVRSWRKESRRPKERIRFWQNLSRLLPFANSSHFQNSHAIFGITNIFEYLLVEKTPEDAARRETQQLVNIAIAAGETASLEHLVLHTLPAGEKLAGKGNFVPHMDVS